MKIAVIGLGWLGIELAFKFFADAHQIVGTTRSTEKRKAFSTTPINAFKWGFSNGKLPQKLVVATDVCILNIPPSASSTYVEDCVAVVNQFPETARFVFVSSTGVYDQSLVLATEESPVLENSILVLAERAMQQNLKDRVTIIRFGGLIGKQRHPARFLSGKTDVKEPKAPVNLIHIVDCVGLINAIVTQECWGETFNGCASLHPEKKLFYEEVCNRMKITPPIFEDNHSVLNPQVGKRVDNQKSKEMLNYKYEFENPLDMWSEVTNN